MENELKLKEIVKEQYGKIAENSCCSSSCGCGSTTGFMDENYDDLNGYNPDADLGLGCGLPTNFAKIKKGDIVVDLGSGAGNDCFVARAETGENGKVIGIDFTPEMIEKARKNVEKRGFTNIEFIQGDIDKMPLDENFADVIVSNCVLNLVPNKKEVFKEIFRVLKPQGHFSISDIVLTGNLSEKLKSMPELYVACVSGAIQKDEYLKIIEETGFKNVVLQKEVSIILPDEVAINFMTKDEILAYKKNPIVKSITVYAEK
jgi:ubiquinone/menaquinone biosynthesis C-methylase UbiE